MGGEKLGHTVRRQRVNLMNGQHFVVHFFRGRDTPAGDVIRDLFRLLQLSKEYHSFFALWISSSHFGECSDFVLNATKLQGTYCWVVPTYQILNSELQIGDTDKPLKLMSAWKQLVTQYSSIRTKSSLEDVPTFQLRRNIFIPLSKEKLVSIKFINQEILSGGSFILIGEWPLGTTTTVCWCKQFEIVFMFN